MDADGDAGTTHVLSVTGDVDMATATNLFDRLTQAISDAPPGALVLLDTSGVEFCDSQGIRTLLLAHSAAHDAGRRFAIRSVPDNLERLLRIAGVLDVLVRHATAA
jgi:anti-sigma B factor antagonist